MSYYFFHSKWIFLIYFIGENMAKLKKKYLFLIIIIIVGFIVGMLFSNILNNHDHKLVESKIMEYFNNLANDKKIDYWNNLVTSLKNNLLYLGIIWILGLSIIGLLVNNFIIFFKSFILGFSVGSIINIYLYSGIVLSFFYVFPSLIINLIVFMIMTYYANYFSLRLFETIFKKKTYNFSLLIKKYFKILLIFTIILIISSIIETFIMPFFLKLFTFLIK